MHWKHFIQQPHIKPLPLHEQVKRYNYILEEINYRHHLERGRSKFTSDSFFLLQENGDYLMQENGDKIIY